MSSTTPRCPVCDQDGHTAPDCPCTPKPDPRDPDAWEGASISLPTLAGAVLCKFCGGEQHPHENCDGSIDAEPPSDSDPFTGTTYGEDA